MLASANPIEAPPASRSVREFLAVFSRHNLPCGELGCLARLPRELQVNKLLAMHFWSAVADMTDKQYASTEGVLTAIVEAATGQTRAEVRESSPANCILVDRLERLLAGQDAESDLPPSSEPNRRGTNSTAGEDMLPVIRGGAYRESRGSARRREIVPESKVAASSLAGASEESPRLVLVPIPPAAVEVSLSAMSSPEEVVPERVDAQPEEPADRVPSAIPLSTYSETSGRSVPVAALVGSLAGILLAGAIYFLPHGSVSATAVRLGTSVRAGYSSAVTTWKSAPSPAPAPMKPTPPAALTRPAPSQPVNPPQVEARRAKPRPSTADVPSASLPPSVPKLTPHAIALTPAQRIESLAARNEQLDQIQSPHAENHALDTPVAVPETAMSSHLVISRVPVVPERVRANGVTGVVRLQATISRTGSVSRLHVLDGPAELRGPALEAVSAWRYSPYVVNGQPADVTTTVSVDFSSLN